MWYKETAQGRFFKDLQGASSWDLDLGLLRPRQTLRLFVKYLEPVLSCNCDLGDTLVLLKERLPWGGAFCAAKIKKKINKIVWPGGGGGITVWQSYPCDSQDLSGVCFVWVQTLVLRIWRCREVRFFFSYSVCPSALMITRRRITTAWVFS